MKNLVQFYIILFAVIFMLTSCASGGRYTGLSNQSSSTHKNKNYQKYNNSKKQQAQNTITPSGKKKIDKDGLMALLMSKNKKVIPFKASSTGKKLAKIDPKATYTMKKFTKLFDKSNNNKSFSISFTTTQISDTITIQAGKISSVPTFPAYNFRLENDVLILYESAEIIRFKGKQGVQGVWDLVAFDRKNKNYLNHKDTAEFYLLNSDGLASNLPINLIVKVKLENGKIVHQDTFLFIK